MKISKVIAAMLLTTFAVGYQGRAADNPIESKLYATRLQSITVPKHIQEQSAKKMGAAISSTYIYLVLACDGKPAWISPKQKVFENQTKFQWPDTPASVAALLWEKNTLVTVRVFLSDDKIEASASAAGIGAAGGAGAGALIGGIAAGVFTGGLGAPAGALIGAAIGGGAGAAAGGATGALSANDRILFEADWDGKETFPIDGMLEYSVTDLGEKYTALVSFKLLEAKAPAEQGTLELGAKYIVRLRTVELSTKAALKGEKKPDKARYYFVLQQGAQEYSFLEDSPIAITPGIVKDPEIITILKNTGELTQVHIYEDDLLSDDLVFSSTIGKIDGKSWVFIGKAASDDGGDASYIDFETYGPLK